MDDDLPMGNCGAGSGTGSCPEESGNVPAGLPCTVSANCEGELACIAPFIDDDVGEFVCSATCIGLEDEAWWCLDASACCDAAAICTPRGLCMLDVSVDDTAGSGDSTDATTMIASDDATTMIASEGSTSASGSGSSGDASTGDATTSTTGGT